MGTGENLWKDSLVSKKPQCWTFHDNLYGASYALHRGGTWQEAEKNFYHKINKPWEPDEEDTLKGSRAMTLFHPETKSVGFWFKEWGRRQEDYATLAHECVHAANRVLCASGVPLGGAGTDEPHAYYVGWLMRACLEVLRQ